MLTGRRCGGTPVRSTPSSRMRPALGRSKPAISRKSVVLPQPEGPSQSGRQDHLCLDYLRVPRVIYTINNVPYASLTAVVTTDPDERTSISSYRQIAANSAGFIVASLAIPMVKFFGHGNDALGYQLTMGLLSAVSVVFFIIAFLVTKDIPP